ncbi:uncharacterized protein LOC122815196 [Protopterus annectens]|uniref:uncharacterized protein LOC122815196 n=1 Tax=Protopterus annectens TaxID=7888 RepID=UPI001CFB07F3|nr:uncharacterized protein LOC122815196 [Protopterus annectens]
MAATNSTGSETSNSATKHYQWQIKDGRQWLNISHDSVIEVHYSKPSAKGIKLFTQNYGNIFLDFDKMAIKSLKLKLRRNTSLPPGQKEQYLWYFFDNKCWYEYGSQGTANANASMGSPQIEQQYQTNPQGTCQFTVGQTSYILDFRAMIQTNSATGMRRCVKRRPKLNSVHPVNESRPFTPATTVSQTDRQWTWQFLGEEGVWTEYVKNNGLGMQCSVASDDIERSYNANPQGSISFTAGRFTYSLSFAGMFQVNNYTNTRRPVKRIANASQGTTVSSTPATVASSSSSGWTWQFLSDEGIWMEYARNNGLGINCSVNSDDIERLYNVSPRGITQFTAGSFTYTLNFAEMVQVNNRTKTKRRVQRLPNTNQGATGSSVPSTSTSTITDSWMWQFLGDEGVWTDYCRNTIYGKRSSVDTNDIQKAYQQNPQGVIQFTVGKFSYTLSFAEMVQINDQTQTKRMVRRISSTTPNRTANLYLNDSVSVDDDDIFGWND